jgi:putative hydrolase of the HAD superfamily
LIEAIVSDFGGVLTTPVEASFWGFAQEAGIPPEALGAALAARTALDGLSQELTALGHPGLSTDGFARAYFEHLRPNGAMLRELRAWKARGLRLALLTNNVAEWEARWRAMLPVDELFETVVDSAFVGVRKPDPRIYEIALERLALPGSACVFIDDVPENCVAATALGMHAVHFLNTTTTISAVEDILGR